MTSSKSRIGSAEDEQPVRMVTLDAFWLDRTEVTKEQYRLCVADLACNPSEYDKENEYKNDRQPKGRAT